MRLRADNTAAEAQHAGAVWFRSRFPLSPADMDALAPPVKELFTPADSPLLDAMRRENGGFDISVMAADLHFEDGLLGAAKNFDLPQKALVSGGGVTERYYCLITSVTAKPDERPLCLALSFKITSKDSGIIGREAAGERRFYR